MQLSNETEGAASILDGAASALNDLLQPPSARHHTRGEVEHAAREQLSLAGLLEGSL